MQVNQLDVYVGTKKVGELTQENYEYSFCYVNPNQLDPARDLVSLTMPVRGKGYDTQILMPPFQIALPEGALLENLRQRFAKFMDISNDMNLLRLVGHHTIGRIRFLDPAAEKIKSPNHQYSLKELLTYPETENLFQELLQQYALSGVSGVQPKVLWSERGEKISLNLKDYIVKAGSSEYPGLAVNEYFCMRAAQACELNTPKFHLAESGKLLVVERFDRNENNQPLAFEEMSALLHLPNHGKYSSSYEAIAQVIRQVPCEPQALRDYFKAVVLNMMIGNGDAHLKNFGILYDEVSKKWLAPIYDLVTTKVYLPNDVPALTIANKKSWPNKKQLLDFGLNACNLRKRIIEEALDTVKAGIAKIKPQLKRYGNSHADYKELCECMIKIWEQSITMLLV